MAAETHKLQFPLRETLADFFRMDPRRRVRVPMLARLLGVTERRLRRVLSHDGVKLRFDSLEWGEAAAYLLDAWPRAQVIDGLGPEAAGLIPSAYHPSSVVWRIPTFIVRAVEHQAAQMYARDPRKGALGGRFSSPSVDDYVADILFSEIDDTTVAALADDPAFVEAFHYPLGE